MKYRKSFEKLDTFIEGNNTVDFWEWYYRGKFKEEVEFFGAGKRDYFEELKKHYYELLPNKEVKLAKLNHENYYERHSAEGLLNQLSAMEIIFKENEIEI